MSASSGSTQPPVAASPPPATGSPPPATGSPRRASGYARRLLHLAALPVRASWRWPAAGTLLVAGAVHIPITGEHLREAPYIGALFIALTVACFGCAVLLLVADSRPAWAFAAAVNAAAVVAYLLSRTVGLPEIGDDVGDWADPLGVVALVTETTTVALAGLALRRPESAVTTAINTNALVHPEHQGRTGREGS